MPTTWRWRCGSPTTPTPLEIYPALAFDRLFKDGERFAQDEERSPRVQRELDPEDPVRFDFALSRMNVKRMTELRRAASAAEGRA